MSHVTRFLVGLVLMLAAMGCGRYYDIGSPHGARGDLVMLVPATEFSPGGWRCLDCAPREVEPTAMPYVAPAGPPLPRSKRDVAATNDELPAFDPVAARSALNDVDLSSCRAHGAPKGHGHARVVVNGDGHVSKATIDAPPGLTKEAADCIGSRLGAATVPAFRGSLVTVGVSYYVP